MQKTGVLLINLGTPESTKLSAIRRYLAEFLTDPDVIDLPALFRYLLVYGIIVPFRSPKTQKAYQAIWRAEGSPLRIHTEQLTRALSEQLGQAYEVKYAMRYGMPSISSQLELLKECQQISVLPLFPQYSQAANGSSIKRVLSFIKRQTSFPEIKIVDRFYREQGFVDAWASLIKPYLNQAKAHLLLSYHGLPERQIVKSGCKATCDRQARCPTISEKNQDCYRAQCVETSRLIQIALQLTDHQITTAFQSRLGRVPWIKPYLEETLSNLYQQGIRDLVVASPSFVADCLETLEELGIRMRKQWLDLGGNSFELVPCLNEHDRWISALQEKITQVW